MTERGPALPQSQFIVVVIPGIGGSKLSAAEEEPAWGYSRLNYLHALTHPQSLSLAVAPRLRPQGLINTLRVIPGVFAIPGYDGLVRKLTNCFTNGTSTVAHPDEVTDPGADVVEFGYDFRLGVVDAAERLDDEIQRRLERLSTTEQNRRVVIVAHSMGGLIARYWLGLPGRARYCRSLITIGTPHRGAPKALGWAVNGARIGPAHFPKLSAVIGEWQGLYDLLPRTPTVWLEGEEWQCYPLELAESGAVGLHRNRAERALEMHQTIEEDWTVLYDRPRSEVPDLVTISAEGHDTPLYASVDGDRLRLHQQLDDRHRSLPLRAGLRGDGTVPAQSAVPLEEDDEAGGRPERHHRATERHGPMSDSAHAVRIVGDLVDPLPRGYRGDDAPKRPMLGTDIDQFTLAGQPFTVRARLDRADPAGVTARARLSALDRPGRPWESEMQSDGEGWRVDLPGLEPGMYELRLSASGIAGSDPVGCSETIVAVDPS